MRRFSCLYPFSASSPSFPPLSTRGQEALSSSPARRSLPSPPPPVPIIFSIDDRLIIDLSPTAVSYHRSALAGVAAACHHHHAAGDVVVSSPGSIDNRCFLAAYRSVRDPIPSSSSWHTAVCQYLSSPRIVATVIHRRERRRIPSASSSEADGRRVTASLSSLSFQFMYAFPTVHFIFWVEGELLQCSPPLRSSRPSFCL